MGKRIGVVILVGVGCGLGVIWYFRGGPSWYGVGVMTLFTLKIVLSWKSAPKRGADGTKIVGRRNLARPLAPETLRVGVAVPVYNEDPTILVCCLKSLLYQTRPVDSVVVIDDGSADPQAFEDAAALKPQFDAAGIPLILEKLGANRGKRHVLMRALDLQPHVDALLGVDSDTVLDGDAVGQLVDAYCQPGVTAVTGLVLALNHDWNLLTRLIDLRYAQSFLVDRGAQSRLGSMLCACGSLALYSGRVLRKYRKDFLGQTFLGRPAIFGDDRRLTNYCLLEGKAVLEETAVAYTAVPERFGHFLRQQTRWNKSFFRESLWVLRAMPLRKAALWITLVELWSWVVFTTTLVYALAVAPVVTAQVLVGPYLLYVTLMAYARAFRYPDLTGIRPAAKDRWLGFLIAPLYGVLHIGVLVWLRLWSLVTLRRGNWGTRQHVEVSFARPVRAIG